MDQSYKILMQVFTRQHLYPLTLRPTANTFLTNQGESSNIPSRLPHNLSHQCLHIVESVTHREPNFLPTTSRGGMNLWRQILSSVMSRLGEVIPLLRYSVVSIPNTSALPDVVQMLNSPTHSTMRYDNGEPWTFSLAIGHKQR